jgi:hypothetical protein
LERAEQRGDGDEHRGDPGHGQHRVDQQAARDPQGARHAGPSGDQGVAYDDGEVRAGQGDHARDGPGEGDELCVHAHHPAGREPSAGMSNILGLP